MGVPYLLSELVSTCIGFLSPDKLANALTSCWVNARLEVQVDKHRLTDGAQILLQLGQDTMVRRLQNMLWESKMNARF